MRKCLMPSFSLLFLLITVFAVAQKKDFSFEQSFRGSATGVQKPLPMISKWIDDDHYVEIRRDEKDATKSQTMSVDVKTGNAVPYDEGTKITPSANATYGLKNNEKNITASPDGKWVAYTRNNNLYAMEVATKKEVQFTSDGNDSILNGWASWVYYEEILGRQSRYRAFWWSPDSKHIAFMHFDDSPVPVFPIYVIKDQHGYLENERYPKAGDKNPYVKIGIVAMDDPKTTWADFNEKDDQYFGQPLWTPDGKLWVQWMNRGQDNLKIYEIDNASGGKKEIYSEKQEAWIDLDEAARIEFLPSGKSFILKSDKDGWENLYLHDMNGKQLSQVTTGTFWGTAILKVDEKAKQVYIRARKENSARFDVYRVGLDGKGLTRLTFGDYSFEQVNISPNAKYFTATYSNVSTPTKLVLMDMKGKVVRELGDSKGADFNAYNIPKTELRRVKSADGMFDLPVIITYPTNFDPNKKYPVLVGIYGGPNAGTVYDRWKPVGGASQWWAQEGMILVSFDNRSSGHFGKKGLNQIHRQLGKHEIEDYMDCARWMRQQSWVDTNKIAITGGSFGGYMTCMALTYGADVFNYGVANSSVTDWQFYDTHYTERFMDTPQENPEGYKATSVMTYADRYKGLLRIIHGTSDDNVHMQNSLVLINRLEDLKKHFEFMMYPGERHGIGGSKGQHNGLEAYKFYYDFLLNKPMPEQFWGNPTGRQQRGF
jgi:dipeptidyl-peptidase-4